MSPKSDTIRLRGLSLRTMQPVPRRLRSDALQEAHLAVLVGGNPNSAVRGLLRRELRRWQREPPVSQLDLHQREEYWDRTGLTGGADGSGKDDGW